MVTVFDKIIAKKKKEEIVYEDKEFIAFLDNFPANSGHTLIVPKKKSVNLLDMDDKIAQKMIVLAKKIGVALKKATKCGGINIIMNNGKVANQEVMRAHLHVIPRYKNDGFLYLKRKKTHEKGLKAKILKFL